MKVNAGILIDFGNSETRMSLLVNNKVQTTVLSNRFAALTPGYNVPAEYNNDKSNKERPCDLHIAYGCAFYDSSTKDQFNNLEDALKCSDTRMYDHKAKLKSLENNRSAN